MANFFDNDKHSQRNETPKQSKRKEENLDVEDEDEDEEEDDEDNDQQRDDRQNGEDESEEEEEDEEEEDYSIDKAGKRKVSVSMRSLSFQGESLMKLQEALKRQQELQDEMQREQYNFNVDGRKLLFAKNALFCFDASSEFRQKVVWLIEWIWFERFITSVIVLNTFLLMFRDYSYRLDGSTETDPMSLILLYLEYFFAVIFFSEYFLKIIGMGFLWGTNAYLRHGWNTIDFVVVISSIVTLTGGVNLSSLRTIRVLRPLRSINALKGLKQLISSILDAIPDLGNVVVFILYLMVLFGILGMQLFIGQTESRCRTSSQPVGNLWPADPNYTNLCFDNDDSTCPVGLFCRNPIDQMIPKQTNEDFIYELNFGFTSFDNILIAFFTIFQALTTEGWSKFVYIYQYAVTPAIVYIYFVVLILIGSFFALNLILAVINESFLKNQEGRLVEQAEDAREEKQEKKRQKDEERRRKQSSSKIHPDMGDDDSEDASPPNNIKTKGALLELQPMHDNSESDEDDSAKRREKELFKIALKPVYYTGRGQLLKKLEDQHNRHAKEKMNFFDPVLTTLNKQDNQIDDTEEDADEQMIKVRLWVVEEIIESKFFNFVVTVFIIVNTIVLSLDRYPQSASEASSLYTANLIFTLFFMIEMFIKLFGYGFRNYFRDSLNVFDCAIVVISLIEQILDQFDSHVSGGSFTAIAAFRALRLFRIFKLARQWTSFRQLLIAILNTLEQISHFVVLFLLFMIIGALLGMEFFAYEVRFDTNGAVASNKMNATSPLLNFDTFYNAMILIFVLITGENWNLQTYLYMMYINAQFNTYSGVQSWAPVLFFSVVVIIGNFILLKLFLVILLYNFGQTTVEAKKKVEEQLQRTGFAQILEGLKSSIHQGKGRKPEERKEDDPKKAKKKLKKPIEEYQGDNQNSDAACFFQGKYDEERFDQRKVRKQNKLVVRFFDSAQVQDPDELSDDSVEEEEQRKINQDWLNQEQLRLKQQQSLAKIKKGIFYLEMKQTQVQAATLLETQGSNLFGTSLYLFAAKTKFRKSITKLVNHKVFEAFIIIMIILSSILLALDNPLQKTQNTTLANFDIFITSVFITEAAFKIISQGFIINGPNSYLRQIGNILDFIVIVFSALAFNQSNNNSFGKIKIVRVLRVLRPLRLISRNEGLKVAINALILSIPQILNLVLVCVIFFLLFGIFGVNVFKGSFFYCDTRFIPKDLIESIMTDRDCYDLGGDWVNQDFNFDNILNAMVSLFVIATTEGWVDLMQMGVNSRGINLQPKSNYHIYWQLFYVGFIVVGAFFIMNLFVGVVVDAFNTEKNKLRGYFYLTLEQQEWIDIQLRIIESKPQLQLQVPRRNWYIIVQQFIPSLRTYMFNITQHPRFEKFILVLIVLNTILFMVQYVRQSPIQTTFIYAGNIVFLVAFAIEALMKIIATGTMYFRERFNVFDLVVVTLSLLGFILETANVLQGFGTATSILRTFRIVRVLRLVRTAGSLRTMFQTFIRTLPALANIGGLLCIILFIYAVLGLNLYPYLRRSNDQGITTDTNFSSFLNSFFTMFKSSTGEQWEFILADSTRQRQPNYICNYEPSYQEYAVDGLNACGDGTAYLFQISFQILFATIMLNLFVAVIIEGFQSTVKEETSKVKAQDIEQFQEIWKQFDPSASGFIRASLFTQFMLLLPKPLGWIKTMIQPFDQRKGTSQFEIPAYILRSNRQANYFYYDVLKALSHKQMIENYGDVIHLDTDEVVKAQIVIIEKRQKKLDHKRGITYGKFNSADFVAGLTIKKHLWQRIQKKYDNEIKKLRKHQANEEDADGIQNIYDGVNFDEDAQSRSPPQVNQGDQDDDMLINNPQRNSNKSASNAQSFKTIRLPSGPQSPGSKQQTPGSRRY